MSGIRRVDAHQHFWHVARQDYAWLTAHAYPELYRDFDPPDLAPLLARCGIDATVLVQGAETDSETEFLLGIAHATPFVAGVVGWTDLTTRGAPVRIERLARRHKLVGLRPMLEIIEDDQWILDKRLEPAFTAMQRHGLKLDALVRPRHLPALRRFLDAHPDLDVVIDHAAKPAIATGELRDWSEQMQGIAASSEVFVKVSGLATEAGPNWSAQTLAPYVEVLLDCFGPDRLMWGSDWPVLNVAGSYQMWYEAAQRLMAGLDDADRDRVFGGTATRFYGLADD